MALVQATTWTMYLSRRRGTIHSLERWRALAGYPKHATKIARSTPLRLVCHSFTSTIYLPILARKDGILIPYFLIRMCVRTVPQGESYNFIGTWRFVQVVASSLKLLLLFPWVFFCILGIGSEHVREEFLSLSLVWSLRFRFWEPFWETVRVTWNKFGVNILEGSLMGSKGKL